VLGTLEGKGFPSDAHFIEQYPIIDTNTISQFVVIYSLENIYFCRKFIFLRLYVNIMKIVLTTGIVLLATARCAHLQPQLVRYMQLRPGGVSAKH
jgi:hypothetical protein